MEDGAEKWESSEEQPHVVVQAWGYGGWPELALGGDRTRWWPVEALSTGFWEGEVRMTSESGLSNKALLSLKPDTG